jgi:hypothetical protein
MGDRGVGDEPIGGDMRKTPKGESLGPSNTTSFKPFMSLRVATSTHCGGLVDQLGIGKEHDMVMIRIDEWVMDGLRTILPEFGM